MEQKKLKNVKAFFKSFINNRVLFERRKNTIWIPLAILILIISILGIPPYLVSKGIKQENLVKNFPKVEEPFNALFTSSMDCSVRQGVFTCEEGTPAFNMVVGDQIKYTIIANQQKIALDTTVSYNAPKNTDNLIFLYNQTVRIRYIERDHVNQTVKTYEIIGDYSTLEGFSLEKINQELTNNPESLKTITSNFIYDIYSSTLETQLLLSIASSIVSFIALALVTCLIIKSPTLFKRRKGFTFKECFKISLTSAAPIVLICLLLSLIMGFGTFATIFGLLFVIRILFIYFKYLFSGKIYKEIYAQENDERFNI